MQLAASETCELTDENGAQGSSKADAVRGSRLRVLERGTAVGWE